MFIGHYATAFVAATHPKAPNLGTLCIAAQLVDFGFFAFVLTGIEKMKMTHGITTMNNLDLYHMPYTHSLLGGVIAAMAFAAIIYQFSKNKVTAALAAGVVISHWFVDLLVHAPDLTLYGQPPKMGFALWNHPWIEIPLELGITFGALYFLIRKFRKTGYKANRLLILAGALFALQLFDWMAPAPDTVETNLPITALIAFSLVAAMGYWANKKITA